LCQQTLKDLGFFTGPPPGNSMRKRSKRFNAFNVPTSLLAMGVFGRRTLLLLLHVGADALASTT